MNINNLFVLISVWLLLKALRTHCKRKYTNCGSFTASNVNCRTVISSTVTVTAVRFFAPFYCRSVNDCRPVTSNIFSSILNVLDIIIGSINIHNCTKQFKYYTNCEVFIFSELMTSTSFLKTTAVNKVQCAACCVQCPSYK